MFKFRGFPLSCQKLYEISLRLNEKIFVVKYAKCTGSDIFFSKCFIGY